MARRTDPIAGYGMQMPHPAMQHPAMQQRQGRLAERTRWLWLIPLAVGVVTVFGWVASHDPGKGLALSRRGWLTLAAAAVLVWLISVHRNDGLVHLARMVGEYAVVAALVVLVTITASTAQSPAEIQAEAQARAQAQAQARAAGACPPVVQVRAWLSCLWHQAGEAADQQASPTTTTRPRR